jgi:hypothetical protein
MPDGTSNRKDLGISAIGDRSLRHGQTRRAGPFVAAHAAIRKWR